MALTFGFYADPGLTTPVRATLAAAQSKSAPTPVDLCIWFGSPAVGKLCQSQASPGVQQIAVSVVNATPGSNSPASDIRLAKTRAGLDTAMPGAMLNLAASVQSGVAHAIPVFIRVINSLTTTGRRSNLSLATQTLVETA
jgi:hypothetical protein